MRLGTPRDPGLTFLLIVLTCGIYYLYFIYVVSQETQDFLEEHEFSPGLEVLLSVITCGLWNIYWDYRIGKRVAAMCGRVGLPVTDNAILYLVLDLVGAGGFGSLGIINPVLQQDSLNRIWKAGMTPPQDAFPTPRRPRPSRL